MRSVLGACCVLAGLLWLVELAGLVMADSAHAGDYTWRTQTVIGWVRWPMIATGVALIALLALEAHRLRHDALVRRPWVRALALVLPTAVIVVAFVLPLEARIMKWDPNMPPPEWSEVRGWRTCWYAVALLLGMISLVATVAALAEPRVNVVKDNSGPPAGPQK